MSNLKKVNVFPILPGGSTYGEFSKAEAKESVLSYNPDLLLKTCYLCTYVTTRWQLGNICVVML